MESYCNTGAEISSLDSENFIQLSEVYSQKLIPVSKENIPSQEDISSWPHLKEVKLPTIQADIGLLIGANVPQAMEPLQVVKSVDNGPYAVRTLLGWTINGPLRGGREAKQSDTWTKVTVNRISVARLEELWQLQFKQDFPDAGLTEELEMSKDDHQFISMVSQSAELKDGHYSICLPVKNKELQMPNNRSVAEQRALNLKKRFSRDKSYYKEYVTFMDGILEKGYAVEITNDERETQNERIWYLPHHGVRHPVKENLRVVFDCGAGFGGTSLNQELLQGPDLTSSLVGVLLRFRQETVAMTADVEAMFYQVRVSDGDTDLLRFLWWPHGDYNQQLVEYKMKVHIFGATSSPSVATFAMQKCASDFGEEFGPDAARTVLKNFYVDDCIKSTVDEDSAVSLAAALTTILAKGGFRLTKWSSNSRKLLQTIPANERAHGFQDLDLDQDYLPVERALGIQWCAETDKCKFKINLRERPHTRRGLLSLSQSGTIENSNHPKGLELTAATVAIKMDKLLRKERELNLLDSVFWTDSTAVIKYLNKDYQLMPSCDVKTGCVGPDFILQSPEQWPKNPDPTVMVCEDLEYFKDDIMMLKEQHRVKRSSPLHKLNPVLQDGVMRVGGGLSRSAMPTESKQPVILPKHSHVSRLVLRDIHEITAHAGRNHMLAKLREKFWIPGATGAIRRLLSKCVVCRRLHGTAGKQLMADLPECRLLPDDPPFTRVGMDYFGPFLVRRGRAQVKRYGVIFTCLAVRAVHLEVASSLDTDACLNAVRRFVARRGQVNEMYSDNGTNMRAADTELKQALQQWNSIKISTSLQQKGIQWHFNPSAGSHHGGRWERLIRSVRKILNVTIKEKILDEEGLQTLLCEAEAVINNRPITRASSDVNDLEALTPNHLLLLKTKPSLPLVFSTRKINIPEEDGNKSSTWQTSSGNAGVKNISHTFKNARGGLQQ
ncbi:hypothetical protein WMY93_000691 [Mugilogobius chulae]|uniref:Integrase catalytic domain-containing protein n=1 Tax=Mugilogobius chulae TaxID=88201 RepID=A0AAW0Q143_9GOBI